MKIYIGHSKLDDFKNDLYIPIREKLGNYNIIFPHEKALDNYLEREFYKSIDLFIAEVSTPATGLGIELGYADDDDTPIYCIYKKGSKYSGSLTTITDKFYEYKDTEDMIRIIEEIICRNYQK